MPSPYCRLLSVCPVVSILSLLFYVLAAFSPLFLLCVLFCHLSSGVPLPDLLASEIYLLLFGFCFLSSVSILFSLYCFLSSIVSLSVLSFLLSVGCLPSFIFCLPKNLSPRFSLSCIRLLSSIFCPLPSLFFVLASVIYRLSNVVCCFWLLVVFSFVCCLVCLSFVIYVASVFCHLSSPFCVLSAALWVCHLYPFNFNYIICRHLSWPNIRLSVVCLSSVCSLSVVYRLLVFYLLSSLFSCLSVQFSLLLVFWLLKSVVSVFCLLFSSFCLLLVS